MQLSNSGKTDADVTLLFTWAVCRNPLFLVEVLYPLLFQMNVFHEFPG